MYDCDNPNAAGKDPTVRFDNKNTLPTNRLMLVETETVEGDINADGVFDNADAAALQKWLLTVPEMHPANWRAGDLNKDGRLDARDLSMMKRRLLKK